MMKMGRIPLKMLFCIIIISSLTSAYVCAAVDDCNPGYEFRRKFIRCVQSNCNGDIIPDAHLSYVGDCVCGSSGSMNENPDHNNKECARPHDYPGCPGCVYACVHSSEKCPDEKEAEASTTTIAADEDEPEYGIIEKDGKLFIISPPGGVLQITMSDLPEWARTAMVTVGAVIPVVGPPDTVMTGDNRVLLDGLPVARINDDTVQGGKIVEGSDRIFINGEPAAFRGGYTVNPMMTGLIPRVGGPIAWNCASGATADMATPVECMQENREREGMSEDEFCAAMERRVRSDPVTGGSASWALSEFCRPSVRTLRKGVNRGEKMLDVESDGVEVGDQVVIGSDPSLSETGKVAELGSIILEKPLKNDYPAGTLVTLVPKDIDDMKIEAGKESNSPSFGFGGAGAIILLLGGVSALIMGFAVLLGIAIIAVIWALWRRKR